MRNGFAMQKINKCMYDRRTIRSALAAFSGNIYQKRVCTRIVLFKFKGAILQNNFRACSGMHDFCVRISIISRIIRSRIQNIFST
jgi:hypothetical protein